MIINKLRPDSPCFKTISLATNLLRKVQSEFMFSMLNNIETYVGITMGIFQRKSCNDNDQRLFMKKKLAKSGVNPCHSPILSLLLTLAAS